MEPRCDTTSYKPTGKWQAIPSAGETEPWVFGPQLAACGSLAWQFLGSQTCLTRDSKISLPGVHSRGICTYFIDRRKMLLELWPQTGNSVKGFQPSG